MKQVILNKQGNSYYGFHTLSKAFNKSLDELLRGYRHESNDNRFFVIEIETGIVRAAQRTAQNAIKYMADDRALVHFNQTFV